jgi:hypothetical protein
MSEAPNFEEALLATAVQLLLDEGEQEAATLLRRCALSYRASPGSAGVSADVYLTLTAPNDVYKILSNYDHPCTETIRQTFQNVMPADHLLAGIEAVEVSDPAPN